MSKYKYLFVVLYVLFCPVYIGFIDLFWVWVGWNDVSFRGIMMLVDCIPLMLAGFILSMKLID